MKNKVLSVLLAATLFAPTAPGLPDVIPEHNLVRDPVSGNYFRLSQEEMRAWAPRPTLPTGVRLACSRSWAKVEWGWSTLPKT